MSNTAPSIEDLLSNKGKQGLTGKKAAPTDDKADKKTKKGKLASEISAEEMLAKKLKKITIGDEEEKVINTANEQNVDYIDLAGFPISAEALRLIPENICQEQKIICFVHTGEEVRIGTTNTNNPEIEKISHSLEDQHNVNSKVYLISERNLQLALALYAKAPKYKKPVSGVEVSEEEMNKFQQIAKNFKELGDHLKKVSTTEMVTLIIAAGVQAGSSDLHIEAGKEAITVRFRVDGVLHETASIDKKLWPKVISRMKLLSGLKMNITTAPQDGRFTIHLSDQEIDVRVSTMPTNFGESVVMRLLKSSSISLGFEDLGVTGKSFENLKYQTERPNGMIITTGPTGSGKTTTLYAILNKLNTEDVKIITLEDPIEYKLAGLNQSQIDHSKGYSFADGLRSILRQDPDIVMVGEMRDLETADVAINAALTGHMVISTIHTNSAAGAVPRFLAMGVKPFLLAPALNAIMGQRLIRRLCKDCKQEQKLDDKSMARVKEILGQIPEDHPDRPDLAKLSFMGPSEKGCDTCNGLGYKGRLGIYEIMAMTEEIEKVILSGKVSEYDMLQIAIKNGMITMVQDGIIKALAGITSIEEVFRVSE
jgi:type IV pilus assembly protein PilB